MQGIKNYNDIAEQESLDSFLKEHKSLVHKIAVSIKKKLPHFIDLNDLLQSGYIGLLEARKNFDKNKKVAFNTFATLRIKGAILDGLRKNSWVNRDALKKIKKIQTAISQLQQKLSRDPSTEEIVHYLNMSYEDYSKYCCSVNMNMMSFNQAVDIDQLAADHEENPSQILEKKQLCAILQTAISHLPEKEQLVLSYCTIWKK